MLSFTGGATSDAAKQLWSHHLGFAQGRLDVSAGIGGERLNSAPELPKLGGPDDPGRMLKDWHFYKYRPHHSSLSCSLNRYGPDFRWPGLNNTPAVRHHLALVKRPTPKSTLDPPFTWTGMPRLEPGPGVDYMAKRQQAERAVEEQCLAAFRSHRQSMQTHMLSMTAKREALQTAAFSEPAWSTR
mmetsp:Transcript_57044/g.113329  ORF Transcript_57044/g.113329 Transcript_57044/m.113329 type:complete len:185 (-) Transcript_57044:255-809(-)